MSALMKSLAWSRQPHRLNLGFQKCWHWRSSATPSAQDFVRKLNASKKLNAKDSKVYPQKMTLSISCQLAACSSLQLFSARCVKRLFPGPVSTCFLFCYFLLLMSSCALSSLCFTVEGKICSEQGWRCPQSDGYFQSWKSLVFSASERATWPFSIS